MTTIEGTSAGRNEDAENEGPKPRRTRNRNAAMAIALTAAVMISAILLVPRGHTPTSPRAEPPGTGTEPPTTGTGTPGTGTQPPRASRDLTIQVTGDPGGRFGVRYTYTTEGGGWFLEGFASVDVPWSKTVPCTTVEGKFTKVNAGTITMEFVVDGVVVRSASLRDRPGEPREVELQYSC